MRRPTDNPDTHGAQRGAPGCPRSVSGGSNAGPAGTRAAPGASGKGGAAANVADSLGTRHVELGDLDRGRTRRGALLPDVGHATGALRDVSVLARPRHAGTPAPSARARHGARSDAPSVRSTYRSGGGPAGTLASSAETAETTLTLAVPLAPPLAAVIVTAPGRTPLTIPVPETLARSVSEDDHVTARPASAAPAASRGTPRSCSNEPAVTTPLGGVILTLATAAGRVAPGPPILLPGPPPSPHPRASVHAVIASRGACRAAAHLARASDVGVSLADIPVDVICWPGLGRILQSREPRLGDLVPRDSPLPLHTAPYRSIPQEPEHVGQLAIVARVRDPFAIRSRSVRDPLEIRAPRAIIAFRRPPVAPVRRCASPVARPAPGGRARPRRGGGGSRARGAPAPRPTSPPLPPGGCGPPSPRGSTRPV